MMSNMEPTQLSYTPSLPTRPPLPTPVARTRPDVSSVLRDSFGFVESKCVVCSRVPALALPLRRELGLVFVRQTTRSKALLCREHGAKQARRFLLRTLVTGWWGVISFFMNFVAIGTDVAAWRKYNQLLSPQGVAVINPNALAEPRAFGGRRTQLIILATVVGFVVVVTAVGLMFRDR